MICIIYQSLLTSCQSSNCNIDRTIFVACIAASLIGSVRVEKARETRAIANDYTYNYLGALNGVQHWWASSRGRNLLRSLEDQNIGGVE